MVPTSPKSEIEIYVASSISNPNPKNPEVATGWGASILIQEHGKSYRQFLMGPNHGYGKTDQANVVWGMLQALSRVKDLGFNAENATITLYTNNLRLLEQDIPGRKGGRIQSQPDYAKSLFRLVRFLDKMHGSIKYFNYKRTEIDPSPIASATLMHEAYALARSGAVNSRLEAQGYINVTGQQYNKEEALDHIRDTFIATAAPHTVASDIIYESSKRDSGIQY